MTTYTKTFVLLLLLSALSWPVAGCSAGPIPATPAPETPVPISPALDDVATSTPQSEPESLPNTPDAESVADDSTPEPADSDPEIDQIVRLLKDMGPAPEFAALTWINADPTTLADLRGRVVMIEFWSFG